VRGKPGLPADAALALTRRRACAYVSDYFEPPIPPDAEADMTTRREFITVTLAATAGAALPLRHAAAAPK
jgi:hypothetical protein